jgi:hypothetical protein
MCQKGGFDPFVFKKVKPNKALAADSQSLRLKSSV